MKETNATKTIINTSLILVGAWILTIPAILIYLLDPESSVFGTLKTSMVVFGPLVALFFFNYAYLCPKCFSIKKRRSWFFIINAVLIFGWRLYRVLGSSGTSLKIFNAIQDYTDNALSIMHHVRWSLTVYHVLIVVFQILIIAAALAVYYVVKSADLKATLEMQKRKATEAELSWLKNQLNPHFLFNTLNNISSLAAIDSEKTQDSIAQLSDLLRYVLYESNKETVQLSKEIEFMSNYIDLMKLRCNNLTNVNVHFDVPSENIEIAPLLFISLIENAFKHGVNARKDSFVDVEMTLDSDDSLLFICKNSIHETQKSDMSGSGIGIQNMQKRLDLIYPGRYEFDYGADNESYVASLKITGLSRQSLSITESN